MKTALFLAAAIAGTAAGQTPCYTYTSYPPYYRINSSYERILTTHQQCVQPLLSSNGWVDCGRHADTYCECERVAVESMLRLSCQIHPSDSNAKFIRDYKSTVNNICGTCSWQPPAEPPDADEDADEKDSDTDSSGSSGLIIGVSAAAYCLLVGAGVGVARYRKQMGVKEAQVDASSQYVAFGENQARYQTLQDSPAV